MSADYRGRLHNAPPSLSALAMNDRAAFERVIAERHAARRDRWLREREAGATVGLWGAVCALFGGGR